MHINDIAVNIDDSVWDVLLGWGIIEAVSNDGSFRVRFGDERQIYQPGGRRGASKAQRLFWQDLTGLKTLSPGDLGRDEMRVVNDFIGFIRTHIDLSESGGSAEKEGLGGKNGD